MLALCSMRASPGHCEARSEAAPGNQGSYAAVEGHGSFLSNVADRTQIQNTFGYALQFGYRLGDWGVSFRLEHNLWIASEINRALEQGALNIGIAGELLYFDRRVRAMIALGPSILLFDTGIDEAGEVGLFVDARPVGLRWQVRDGLIVQWDPLTFTLVAPVLSGIPLVMLEYRTAVSVEFDMSWLVR